MIDVVNKRHPISGRDRPQERDFSERPRAVRVVPVNDTLRKYLKHGITKVGFLAEGSSEWPNDQFTRNRIREGVITIEEAAPKAEAEAEPKAIEASGAKASSPRKDKQATPSETAATVDPDKTTAPKT